MRESRCQLEEIVPVAGDHDRARLDSVGKDLIITGVGRHDIRNQLRPVTVTSQQVRDVPRHVVVQEERHAEGFSVCDKASTSISARWSS